MVVTSGKRRDDACLLAGYGGLLGFFVLECLFRQPGNASTLASSEGDQARTRLIIAAYAAATDLTLLARRLPTVGVPDEVARAGLAVQSTGLALRGYSIHAIGASYSRTLRTEEDRRALVQTGPEPYARKTSRLIPRAW